MAHRTEYFSFRSTAETRQAAEAHADASNTTVSRVLAAIVEQHFGTAPKKNRRPRTDQGRADAGKGGNGLRS